MPVHVQALPRLGLTASATPRRATWCTPVWAFLRSARCCVTAAWRAPPSTPGSTSIPCGALPSPGRGVRTSERSYRARERLPAGSPGVGVQAGARRRGAAPVRRVPQGLGCLDDHGGPGRRLGWVAPGRAAYLTGPPAGGSAGLRQVPGDDRSGDRGAPLRGVALNHPPSRPLPVLRQRRPEPASGGESTETAAAG